MDVAGRCSAGGSNTSGALAAVGALLLAGLSTVLGGDGSKDKSQAKSQVKVCCGVPY